MTKRRKPLSPHTHMENVVNAGGEETLAVGPVISKAEARRLRKELVEFAEDYAATLPDADNAGTTPWAKKTKGKTSGPTNER